MNIGQLVKLIIALIYVFGSVFEGLMLYPAMKLLSLKSDTDQELGNIFRIGGYWLNGMIGFSDFLSPSNYVVSIDEEDAERIDHQMTLQHIRDSFLDNARPGPNDHREIVISNHQIYADWLYIWGLMSHIDREGSIKIIMKDSLKYIPLVGAAMKMLGFMFLKRDWSKDEKELKRNMAELNGRSLPYDLLIFPEGTTIHREGVEKSKLWIKKNGYPEMEHVLCPRSTGLYSIIKALKENGEDGEGKSVQALVDLTFAYDGVTPDKEPGEVYSLWSIFVEGRAPKDIHVNFSLIPIDEIPTESEEAFTEWLVGRFARKDRLLNDFYNRGKFPAAITFPPKRAAMVKSQAAFSTFFVGLFLILGVLLAFLT